MVRASFMNGSNRDREAQVSQPSRCAELLFEQERAVERLVGLLDFVEQRELADGLFLGGFEQRQRVPLIHLPSGVWERSWVFHSSRRTWSTARWAR